MYSRKETRLADTIIAGLSVSRMRQGKVAPPAGAGWSCARRLPVTTAPAGKSSAQATVVASGTTTRLPDTITLPGSLGERMTSMPTIGEVAPATFP